MHKLANTLYVMTQGAYLTSDHEAVCVRVQKKDVLRVPLHHLEGIICFGRILVSHAVFAAISRKRASLSYLTEQGRFIGRWDAPLAGNVLLRRAQYRRADDPSACLNVARPVVAAKIQNARLLLLRAARETDDAESIAALAAAAQKLASFLIELPASNTLDEVRGLEGIAAREYFAAMPQMVRHHRDVFEFTSRTRRPPKDPLNAILSFLYAMLRHDCESALQAAGLDPAVGFLHVDRPGRPSLALDLMEEFRALLADRLALRLINRRQVSPEGFQRDAGGAVVMTDKCRRAVVAAFQQRKQEEVRHPLLETSIPLGLAPHVQAKLLARVLRGDVNEYPALVLK